MFNQHLIRRSLAGAIIIATAGFPTAAQAMLDNGGVSKPVAGTGSVAYTLPSNFHTDATSGGGYPNHPLIASRVASTLPSNFHTDATSGGGYPNHPPIGSSVQQTNSGFQWDDAGVGAAGAALLLGVAALGAGVTRRHTTQRRIVG
jgi:hypothetical protein